MDMAGKTNLAGGFNPSEKYERQLGWWHSQYMENKIHVPNHQPDVNVLLRLAMELTS